MVFITAGMGGGTGTGAAPIVAQIAKEVRRADHRRGHQALHLRGLAPLAVAPKSGINKLKEQVDTLIVIPNDRLLQIVDKRTSLSGMPSAWPTTCCARASRASPSSSPCPA